MILTKCYNIYISSCCQDGGIYHYRSDGEGNIVLQKKYDMDRPMYLILCGDKLHCLLRAPFENSNDSGLITYQIAEDGSLYNPSKIQSTKGVVACHLAEIDGSVYCVNYVSGSVIKMPDTLDIHEGHGIHEKRQDAAHTHFVCPSPDGKYVFVTDLGMDKIFVYNKDLTVHSTVDMPAGHGPRHLACHPDGKTVFCINELASTVSVLHYEEGTLTLGDTVSTLPEGFAGESTGAAIRYMDGKVYASNRGHDSVAVLAYAPDGQPGKGETCGDGQPDKGETCGDAQPTLKLEKTIPCGGEQPRDMWVDEEVIICTNQTSGNVTFISREDDSILLDLKIPEALSVECAESLQQ